MLKLIKSILGYGAVTVRVPTVESPRLPHVPTIANNQDRADPLPAVQRVRWDPVVRYQELELRRRQDVPTFTNTQPGFKLRSAPWHRDGSKHPIYRSGTMGDRMPQRLDAPARTQSIPGYIEAQIQTTRSGLNAKLQLQYRNLRAPGLNESISRCKNDV